MINKQIIYLSISDNLGTLWYSVQGLCLHKPWQPSSCCYKTTEGGGGLWRSRGVYEGVWHHDQTGAPQDCWDHWPLWYVCVYMMWQAGFIRIVSGWGESVSGVITGLVSQRLNKVVSYDCRVLTPYCPDMLMSWHHRMLTRWCLNDMPS